MTTINVKLKYDDETKKVEGNIAREDAGTLEVYDSNEEIVARFSLHQVEHWWTETVR